MNSEENSTDYVNSFFFDSYAFFEILKGSESYKKYREFNIVTTKLNLFELYYGLLKDFDEKVAEKYFKEYSDFTIDFDDDVLKNAAKMRLSMKSREVSMTDCIGYILAKTLGIKFLTGDKEFENLDNVEYVK